MSQKRDDEPGIIFHTIDDVLNFPDPEWLIKDLIVKGSFAVLFGPPKVGKSFLALSWAFAIAGDKPWLECPVKDGPVVYVAAEGGSGLKQRVAALTKHESYPTDLPCYFHTEAVQFLVEDEVTKFAAAINDQCEQPVLIVIDTLARCFVGGDENSARDMGNFIAGVDQLRRDMDAAVVVIHHTGKNPLHGARGSSALMGAADTMIECSGQQERYFKLQCEKQKDSEPFPDVSVALKPIDLGNDRTSCVIVSLLDAPPPPKPQSVKNVEQVMEILETEFGKTGATHGEWKTVCIEKFGLSESTFDRTLRTIKKKLGLIRIEGSGQGARYFPNWVP